VNRRLRGPGLDRRGGVDRRPGPAAATRVSAPALDPQKTQAVIVGVLRWQDPEIADFDPGGRKDVELYETLGQRGVPTSQRRLLLDEQATKVNIRKAVREAVCAAQPGSTLIFYFAGHGAKVDRGMVLVSSDTVSGKEFQTGFPVAALTPLLRDFKGEQILLMADACFTGALASIADTLSREGKNVVALTSATENSTSTGNWTFTQTVIDALQGRPYLDADGDGSITLGELSQGVADAMLHREFQRDTFQSHGVAEDLVLAQARPPNPSLEDGAGGFEKGDWVWAAPEAGQSPAPARVLGAREGRLLLSFYNYATETRRLVDPSRAMAMTFKTYPVGTQVYVTHDGEDYPAVVVKVEPPFHLVKYDGYSDADNEWVMENQMRPTQ
jgi:hypothetical protein